MSFIPRASPCDRDGCNHHAVAECVGCGRLVCEDHCEGEVCINPSCWSSRLYVSGGIYFITYPDGTFAIETPHLVTRISDMTIARLGVIMSSTRAHQLLTAAGD